jgi:hypothetical protein
MRGQQLVRQLSLEGPAPVYPLLSPVPFHSPVFVAAASASRFQLKRQLDGRQMVAEELVQRVFSADISAVLMQWPAAAPKPDWPALQQPRQGFTVEVSKAGKLVFRQVWLEGLPWALYTESDNVRAWLVR